MDTLLEHAALQPGFWTITAIVLITLVGVAVGSLPRLHMNRATIALVGATALVLVGAITFSQAYSSLDLDTLVLLFAMMVINVNLSLAGFFRLIGYKVIHWARSPKQLLALIMISAGVLSALFLNDTIVLMFTPLVLEMTLALERNPLPYLMGLATAANIGSTATITGNPQNMIIGVASDISYTAFCRYLAPVAVGGLLLAWLLLLLVYRREFFSSRFAQTPLETPHYHRPLLIKGCVAVTLMLIGFFTHLPIPLSALLAASLLLITRRTKPERVFREVDWSLLVFFAGLFVVTGAIEKSGLSGRLFAVLSPIAQRGMAYFSAVSTLLSNLVSNVPAVLLFRPLVPHLADPHQAWLNLAMSSTLAGNLTLLGSMANLIVAESAARKNVRLTFAEYLKSGPLITLVTLIWGVLWLNLML
ncbi:MAG TPA: anion transporter [bacterium]|nr:anion transporter [bacterium]HPN34470.1 anion transporter [bacterium]